LVVTFSNKDNRINFENPIKVLTGKISRSVGVINKLRHTLPLKALRNIYYSMVHPHLLYDIAIWGNTYDKYLKKQVTLRNKAVKLIGGANWQDNAIPHYKKSQILKLKRYIHL